MLQTNRRIDLPAPSIPDCIDSNSSRQRRVRYHLCQRAISVNMFHSRSRPLRQQRRTLWPATRPARVRNAPAATSVGEGGNGVNYGSADLPAKRPATPARTRSAPKYAPWNHSAQRPWPWFCPGLRRAGPPVSARQIRWSCGAFGVRPKGAQASSFGGGGVGTTWMFASVDRAYRGQRVVHRVPSNLLS